MYNINQLMRDLSVLCRNDGGTVSFTEKECSDILDELRHLIQKAQKQGE